MTDNKVTAEKTLSCGEMRTHSKIKSLKRGETWHHSKLKVSRE